MHNGGLLLELVDPIDVDRPSFLGKGVSHAKAQAKAQAKAIERCCNVGGRRGGGVTHCDYGPSRADESRNINVRHFWRDRLDYYFAQRRDLHVHTIPAGPT